jgi:hypothetical protein
MKTNQTMLLAFDNRMLSVEHKTQMGSLTELWAIGNGIRKSKGLPEMDMSNYLRSPETLELVQAIEKSQGFKSVESTDSKNGRVETIKTDLIKTKRGRNGGTWAHLYLMLDAASRMDADFKVMLYDILIKGKLLDWRDDSGDSFKALNIALDEMVESVSGKHPCTAFYQRVASYIKDKIKPTGDNWNTATHEELKRRDKVESKLITVLELNLISSESDIIRVIADMK